MKRFKFYIAVALLVLVATNLYVENTYSYFTYLTAEVNNLFTFEPFDPHIYIEVNEEGIDSRNVSWGTSTKPLTIRNLYNVGAVPAFVRVIIVPSFKIDGYDTENGLGELTKPVDNKLTFETVTLHFASDWEESWFFNHKDGYFYYKTILKPGQETPPLLFGVTKNVSNLGDMELDIEISADGVEATRQHLQYTAWPVILGSDGFLKIN